MLWIIDQWVELRGVPAQQAVLGIPQGDCHERLVPPIVVFSTARTVLSIGPQDDLRPGAVPLVEAPKCIKTR